MMTEINKQAIQSKLEAVTKKWWLYLLLLLIFFISTYASRNYDPRQSIDLISQVLSAPLIFTFPILMPIAKLATVVVIIGLMIYGNRIRPAFNLYIALLYLAIAIFQTTAVTETYGLVVLSGNLALVLLVALVWVWEVVANRNNFETQKQPLWKWWVMPLALVAFLSPVDTNTMTPNFSPARLLTNEALAVLTLFYPKINPVVMRIISFVGILIGGVNMIVWFVMETWGWWMGVLHLPLVVLSIYAFVLSHNKSMGGSPTPL